MRKGVAVVFHGRLFLDQENGNFIHHYNFRVTWKKPPAISEKIALLLEVDGSLFCSNRDWSIREFDSKNDQQKVAGGFGEIVLFLTVVSQLTDPSSSAANIAILERLSAIIGKATEGVTVNLKSGQQVPAEAIPFLRQGRVNALLRDLYLDYGAICIRGADYQTAHRLLHNALKIPSDKSGRISVLVPLALCCYHLGDIKSAKDYSEQINQIDKGNPTALVNLAFLEIVERNYQAAAAWYRRFMVGQYPHEQLVTQVIEFLGERSKEMPNESALVFAVGAINFAYLDHEQGRSDLERFVSAVSNDRQYKQMKVLAERLLTQGLEGERKQFKKQQRRKVV
jgi:tetratricopeptide (TPR) repeat protein